MFFQIDDQLPNSQKHRDLADSVLDGDLRGPAAGFLWVMAGADCQATLSDGMVTRSQIARLMPDAGLAIELAGILVGVGLWHEPGHDCPRCEQPPEKGWIFHDWWDLGYDRADQVKTTRRKRRELKDSKLHAQVWARDCLDPSDPTVAECRYCGAVLKKYDHRGTRKAHLDHVDPTKAAGPENVVLACGDCNRRKGQRTPAQAGMTLSPPPAHSAGRVPGTLAGPSASVAGPDSTMPAAGPARRPRVNAGPTGSPHRAADRPRSPHRAAEPQGSPHEAAVTGTPGAVVDGPQDVQRGPRVPDEHPPADPPPTRSQTHRVTQPKPEPDRVPVRASRAHPGRAGSGQGVGRGVGKGQGPGDGQGSGQPSGSRKRRRRGRGGRSPAGGEGVPSAGACPEVEVAGRWGSPYYGHAGPPLLVEGSDCDRHGLPEPCRKCKTESEAG